MHPQTTRNVVQKNSYYDSATLMLLSSKVGRHIGSTKQVTVMMGPDCGTAVINGVGLGFANKLRRGNIGLAAASGTGLQEVMTLISNFGGRVSQAQGTGGRDLKALELAQVGRPSDLRQGHDPLPAMAQTLREKLNAQQTYIRGLYCGGTLAYESMLQMKRALGDDAFTVGKPHPMIEPSLRVERLLQEALDPSTAVILLDVEIGYGSHENPAHVAAGEVAQAKAILAEQGRQVVFIASICGTYEDVQDYATQKSLLEGQGVVVLESNAQAVQLAILTVSK